MNRHSEGESGSFGTTTQDQLLDSSLMAARFMRRFQLASDPSPVWLDVAGDDESSLNVSPELVEGSQSARWRTSR